MVNRGNIQYRLITQWLICLFGINWVALVNCEAVEFARKSDLQISGMGRYWNQFGLLDKNYSLDNLTVFGNQGTVQFLTPDAEASTPGIELEVRHEFRILAGSSGGAVSTALDYIPIEKPNRFVSLSSLLSSGDNFRAISDFEKVKLQFEYKSVNAWVGRKPVSLGSISFFRVWNQFTRPVSGVFGPVLVYGSDGGGVQYQTSAGSLQALSLLGSSEDWTANLVEGELNLGFGEVKILAGKWWNYSAAGLSLSIPVQEWLLKVESLSWNLDVSADTMAVLGFEGGLGSQWSFDWEFLFQSFGNTETSQYRLTPQSKFSSLRAMYYHFFRVEDQLSAFWRAQLSALLNGIDGGTMVQSAVRYSISDETELSADYSFPVGQKGGEFSTKTFDFGNGLYVGAGQQLVLTLKTSF